MSRAIESNPKSVEAVRQLAFAYRAKLRRLLWLSIAGSLILLWLVTWTQRQNDDWEARVLAFGLTACALLLLFTTAVAAVLLRGWRLNYTFALERAGLFDEDPEEFKRAFREVVGPFPW